MIRVMVTGASGFIGRHAVAALCDHGVTVFAERVDLFDAGAVRAAMVDFCPTHLLHLAWGVRPGYWESPANLDWVAASIELARAFRDAGGYRMVGAGTCAEYGPSHSPLTEASRCIPWTLYGMAKDALRSLLEHAAPAMGLSFVWGRLFQPYGPGEAPGRLLSALIPALLAGKSVECSDGRQIRDFIHVEDAGAALVALLLSEVRGPVNIATGIGTPVRQVLRSIATMTGGNNRLILGARPRGRNEAAMLVADCGRLVTEVGFVPRYDLAAGLAQTVEWYRERRMGLAA
jgi:nucleoside-diphosphate-sugar epimerase